MVPLTKLPKLAHQVDDSMPTRASDYADPTSQRWPCHTGPATLMSWAQFLQSSNREDGVVQAQFYKKASQHGVLNEMFEVSTVVRQAEKQAAVAGHYAIDVTVDGQRQCRMPLDSTDQVKESVNHFRKHRLNWPWPLRKSAAKRLLAAVHSRRLQIEDADRLLLTKTAGLGMCGKNDVLGLIDSRRVAANRHHLRTQVREILDDLTKQANAVAEDNVPQYLEKVASLIDGTDRMLHLDRQYGRGLMAPEDTLFSITEQDLASIQLLKVAGQLYDRADIQGASGEWTKIAGTLEDLVSLGEANPDLVRTVLEAARVEPI